MKIDDRAPSVRPGDRADLPAHAFGIEPTREGFAYVPAPAKTITTPDAENIDLKHEFHDTKFRLVTYKATATSYYVEFSGRASTCRILPGVVGGAEPGVPFEASTVQLILHGGPDDARQSKFSARHRPTPTPMHPADPGDYIVVEDPTLNGPNPDTATHGTIQLMGNAASTAPESRTRVFEFSYVGPTIHTFSDPAADKTRNMHVLNSARPKAPDVLYVVPIYKRKATTTSVARTGGGLRVYLNRPWWSTGAEERLGVVCWHPRSGDHGTLPKTPSPRTSPSGASTRCSSRARSCRTSRPRPASRSRRKGTSNGALSIEESATLVDVAGHDVGYDTTRGLWYCDIQVTDPAGRPLTTYTPFIRLALARYQPFSIPGAHLSRVVLADYAQLAPTGTSRSPAPAPLPEP